MRRHRTTLQHDHRLPAHDRRRPVAPARAARRRAHSDRGRRDLQRAARRVPL